MFERLRQSWVMWAGMLLLAVVPFLSSWRIGPQGGWMIESGSVLFAGLFVLVTAWSAKTVRLPAAAWYFVMLAVFWVLQARIVPVHYVEMSDLTAVVFLAMALLAWACRVQVARLGQSRVADIFAWALLVGAGLQAVVCVLQFAEWTSWLPGLMNAPGKYFVFGQVGQRNHLGHYMMWGVLALAYLWSRRQVANWPAAVLTVFLVGVTGLITSRTILLYIVALAVLLPLLYWRGGAGLKRWCLFSAALIGGVLLAQLTVMPLLSALLSAGIQDSGIGKLAEGNTASPGRAAEWAKAWLIFTEHPWLGVGWQGYAHEGFALAMRDPSFRHYDAGVLFTHSHNSFLEILAEMGLLGSILVVGGWLAVAAGYLKRPLTEASALMLSLMTVSLCHSLMEYPLWYVYFLAPFVVMMSLTPAAGSRPASASSWRLVPVILAAVLLAQTAYYGVAYYYLTFAYANPGEKWPLTRQLDRLQYIEKHDYFLRYYAHMGLLRKVDIQHKPLPVWGREAALRASLFRPYANTNIRAFYLSQEGQPQAAADWLLNMGRYYPEQMPGYLNHATVFSVPTNVVQPLLAECLRYQQISGKEINCQNTPAGAK